MYIKPTILQIFLVLTILFFFFANASYAAGTPSLLFPNTCVKMNPDTGRAVSLDSAQACIDRFPAFMATHGFSAVAGQPINIHLKTTSEITTGESFNGKDLQDWLDQTAAAYAASGKTLMIKVALGVYDMNYLNTYQPNAALRTANNNRIAVFIIPYDAASGQPVKALVAQPMGGTGGSGGTGYDLGGVQP